jgi:hypothetical protein
MELTAGAIARVFAGDTATSRLQVLGCKRIEAKPGGAATGVRSKVLLSDGAQVRGAVARLGS